MEILNLVKFWKEIKIYIWIILFSRLSFQLITKNAQIQVHWTIPCEIITSINIKEKWFSKLYINYVCMNYVIIRSWTDRIGSDPLYILLFVPWPICRRKGRPASTVGDANVRTTGPMDTEASRQHEYRSRRGQIPVPISQVHLQHVTHLRMY